MSQTLREKIAIIRIMLNDMERELIQEEEAEQQQEQEEKHATFGSN